MFIVLTGMGWLASVKWKHILFEPTAMLFENASNMHSMRQHTLNQLFVFTVRVWWVCLILILLSSSLSAAGVRGVVIVTASSEVGNDKRAHERIKIRDKWNISAIFKDITIL